MIKIQSKETAAGGRDTAGPGSAISQPAGDGRNLAAGRHPGDGPGTAPVQAGADRAVFAESHANGRITGTFMVVKGGWKLIRYDGLGELLFDLNSDPQELYNLAEMDPRALAHAAADPVRIAAILADLQSELTRNRDLHMITEEAFADQEAKKNSLDESGQLERELNKRGFHYDGRKLYYLP